MADLTNGIDASVFSALAFGNPSYFRDHVYLHTRASGQTDC